MLAHSLVVALFAVLATGDTPAPSPKRTLADCIRIGIARSLQLSEADYQVRAAEARRSEARWSRWFPFAELNYALIPMPEVRGTVLDGTPICDQIAGVCSSSPTAPNYKDRLGGAWGTLNKIDLNLVFPIDAALKLSAVEAIASRAAEATGLQRERTRRRVVFDITRAFWAVKTARAVDDLLDDGIDKVRSGRRTLEDHLKKKEKGYTKTDLYKFEALNAEVEGRVAEGKKFSALALSTLKLAMGLKEDESLVLDDEELEAVKPQAFTEATVRDMALARRHDIRALEKALEAKRAHVSLQKRQFAPDLFLAFSMNLAHSNVADPATNAWVPNPFNYFNPGGVYLGLRWTLDFPQKAARLRQVQAEMKGLETQFDLAKRAVAFEAKQVYHELAEARAKLVANERAKKSMRSWLTASIINFETGLLETRDLIEAIGAYFRAMATLYRSIHDFNVGVANVALVTETD